jgi:hypothetical protein
LIDVRLQIIPYILLPDRVCIEILSTHQPTALSFSRTRSPVLLWDSTLLPQYFEQ